MLDADGGFKVPLNDIRRSAGIGFSSFKGLLYTTKGWAGAVMSTSSIDTDRLRAMSFAKLLDSFCSFLSCADSAKLRFRFVL